MKYFNVLTLELQTLAVLKTVLEAKEVAEEAVRGSDINYTIIRPGGLLSAVWCISLGEIVIIFIYSAEVPIFCSEFVVPQTYVKCRMTRDLKTGFLVWIILLLSSICLEQSLSILCVFRV